MKNKQIITQIFIIMCVFFVLQTQISYAATFTVSKTADTNDGTCDTDCSLREAIVATNTAGGIDTIVFHPDIAGETIDLNNYDLSSNDLPSITEEAIINGTGLEAGVTISADPEAEAVFKFDNADAGNVIKGLNLNGAVYGVYATGTTGIIIGGSTAGDGLWIRNYSDSGVYLSSDTNSTILGGSIGDFGGGINGIKSDGSNTLIIGGTGANDKNIIINNSDGIKIIDIDTVTILGNYIGTPEGHISAPNTQYGIEFGGTATDVTIGGTADGSRNIISGNGTGIYMPITNATNVNIKGNYIGTNHDGDSPLANGTGIIMYSAATIGGTAPGAGNLISGNSAKGLVIAEAGATAELANVTGCIVQGNKIGLNAAGDNAIANGEEGIEIRNSNNLIGGTTSTARNLISGNGWTGMYINSTGDITESNTITGNYIGVDITGAVDMGNGIYGMHISTNANNTQIGSIADGAENVISGNGWSGIFFDFNNSGGIVEGNIIGLNVAGDTAIPNGNHGIQVYSDTTTIGGATANSRNIVSGNALRGVTLETNGDGSSADHNIIKNNYIGTDITGGSAIANGWEGLYFNGASSNNIIGTAGAGNLISGNSGAGVSVDSENAINNIFKGNYIGTNAAGAAAVANGGSGIYTNSAVTIGGTDPGEGNVISGNTERNIFLGGAGATAEVANVIGSTVLGNKIGTNAAGTAAVAGNNARGIDIYNSNNTIGGTTAEARNIISGNPWEGIYLDGTSAVTEDNIIKGNYIGLNAAGDAAIANGTNGIYAANNATSTIIGGIDAARNLISGNGQRGIYIVVSCDDNTIENNIIGLNADGDTIIGNTWGGIEIYSDDNIIGGSTSASRNIISGDLGGIYMSGSASRNIIKNNYIGTDVTGTVALGNINDGIFIGGTGSDNVIGAPGAGNIIVDNTRFGIFIQDATVTGTIIQGNYVGVDVTGAADLGNDGWGIVIGGSNTQVGGTAEGVGNVISGNVSGGLHIGGGNGGNIIEGNKIGTNAAGTAAISNDSHGVYIINSSNNTIGGITTEARNIISGNLNSAVIILCDNIEHPSNGNIVEGNNIGVNAAGTAALANTGNGVHVSSVCSTGNIIGGTVTGARNIISGNTNNGIYMDGDTTGNTIAGNYIGTNSAGTVAIPNTEQGIYLLNTASHTIGGVTVYARNVISGNGGTGVLMQGTVSGVTVKNNYIGVDVTGNADLGNTAHGIHLNDTSASNFIGVAGYGNVISGNGNVGVYISNASADNNSIQANIIGLGTDGTTAVANFNSGIIVVEASGTVIGTINTPAARNIISSNGNDGEGDFVGVIIHDADNNTIVNNYIGVAADGTTVRANYDGGIQVQWYSDNTIIGGTATGAGNIIASSSEDFCTKIDGSAYHYNTVRGNSCLSEGTTEKNIFRDGLSNEAAATPVITSATTSKVSGTTIFATGNIDVFENGVYQGSTTAVGGVWSLAVPVVSGAKVSASVTNLTGSTSSTTAQTTVTDDVTLPTVSTLSPADGVTDVSTTANLVITFSEAVDAESGNIVIKKTLDDSIVETIAVTDATKVSGSGTNILTINPAATLSALTGYYVQIAATAFDDFSSNSYAGVLDTTNWNFITDGTAGITPSAISGATTEAGGAAVFAVSLDTQPTSNVVIPVSSSDLTEGTISPSSLTFTSANWNTPQTVTLTGVNDAVDDGNIAYSGVLGTTTSSDTNYNALNPNDVSITNTDDDTAGITVSAISGNTTEAGGTATFTVSLNTEPTADVAIPVSSSDTTEGTALTNILTFTSTNWDIDQAVNITGIDDNINDEDIFYNIVLGTSVSSDSNYNNIDLDDVSLSNIDNDEEKPGESIDPNINNNGILDKYEIIDPTDKEAVADAIISVIGAEQGSIEVTYENGTTVNLIVFANDTSTEMTKVKQSNNTGYYVVAQAKGKKVAVINVLNGQIISRAIISKTKWLDGVGLKLVTLRNRKWAMITAKNNNKVQLSLVKIIADHTLCKTVTTKFTSRKTNVNKTTVESNKILIKSSKNKILKQLLFTKEYRLEVL